MAGVSPKLSEADRKTLQAWLADFERTWDEERLTKAVAHLPAPKSPLRRVLLLETVKIDLRRRWQRDLRVTVESYMLKHPELGPAESVETALVQAEYDVRNQFDNGAGVDELAQRFPRQVEEIRAAEMLATMTNAAVVPPKPAEAIANAPTPSLLVATNLSPNLRKTSEAVPETLTKTLIVPPLTPGAAHGFPRQFGRYLIEKTLGQGGMGTVYLAQDTQLKRRVALKMPQINAANAPRVLARFQREAQSAATLVHPYICPVYDVGECEGVHFLTMAFIEGQPLSALIPRGKGMDPYTAADFALRIAQALEEAHSKGIIHRDLKPSNVMVNGRSDPVIMDFGLAYLNDGSDARLTQSGVPLGTPCYMDPEHLTGDSEEVKPTCDIYSLGVLFYEMLTGHLPFTGKNVGQILARAMVEQPDPPSKHRPDLPPRLEAICLKAMAKASAQRYQSMAEIAAELEGFLFDGKPPSKRKTLTRGLTYTDLTTETPPEGAEALQATQRVDSKRLTERPAGRRRKSPGLLPVVLAGVPLLALVGIVVFIMSKNADPEPSHPEPIPHPNKITKIVPAPAPDSASIRIRLSDPSAVVEVSIDDQSLPLREPLSLAPGKHKLRITGKDIAPIERDFEVRLGKNADLDIAIAYFGAIILFGDDPGPGVQAMLDGKPIAVEQLTRSLRLPAGTHTLRLEGSDIDPVSEKITVGRGTNPTPTIALKYFGTVRLTADERMTKYKVEVDGKPREPTLKDPLRLTVGAHKMRVTGDDFDPIEQTIRVKRGANPAIALEPMFFGRIVLVLDEAVKDPVFEIDGKPANGYRPGETMRLSIGKHAVRVTAKGYDPADLEINVKLGLNPARRVTLKRFDPIATAAAKFRNSLDMEMVRVKSGSFAMGSPAEEVGHADNERVHKVKIPKPFYIDSHEVTVRAFRAFVEKEKYRTESEGKKKGAYRVVKGALKQDPLCNWKNPGWNQVDDEPVVCVSWNDARAFCKWLSRVEGRTYRLPKEAEWEYACRAGAAGPFHFGDSLSSTQANFDGKRPYGKGREGPAIGRPAKVGKYEANEWGLFDMHGNVWEWCEDAYRANHGVESKQPTDDRVFRGGSWYDEASRCRSASRAFDENQFATTMIGFRVLCEAEAAAP